MEFFDTIRQVRSNWGPYKKWEIEQQKKEKQNEELRKKYPPTPQELEHAKQYGRTVVDVINTMDQHSIDKSEDASFVIGTYALGAMFPVLAMVPVVTKVLKQIPIVKKKNWGRFTPIVSMMLMGSTASVFINILQAKYEKQASRIARFQTRERDLKDYKHFVIYNEQQINEAKNMAKTLPEVKENKKLKRSGLNLWKDFNQSKKTTDEMNKDYAKYKEWKKEYLKEELEKSEKFKNLNPSKEELNNAERDKKALLSTIKKIENSSLNYLANTSMLLTALNALVLGSCTLVSIGVNNLVERMQKAKVLPESKLVMGIKGFNLVVLPLIASMFMLGSFNKLMKDAARVGRFKAKQELLNDPQNFIFYDDDKAKKVSLSDVKANEPKGFLAKLKQEFKDIKTLKKDYDEYQMYMKTQHKDELKLDEAIKQVEISDNQKYDAMQLQKKVFHSFEIMDEKAQRFTDDTDAAIDITSHSFASSIAAALRIYSVVLCGEKLKLHNAGKIPELHDLLKIGKHLTAKEMTVALIPLILPEFLGPMIKVIATQFKKKAGKIGVMTAMKDLDDPKNFLDEKQS